MWKSQGNDLASLRNSYQVAIQYAPPTPPAAFTQYMTDLQQTIADSDAVVSAERYPPLARDTANKDDAVETLRKELSPLRHIARFVPGQSAGFAHLFVLPRRNTVEVIVAAARQILEAATQYKDVFLAHGRPADFLDQLSGAITNVLATSQQRTVNRARRREATITLAALLKKGRKTVASLDALMSSYYAKNVSILTAWKEAKKVQTIGSTSAETSKSDEMSTTKTVASAGVKGAMTGATKPAIVTTAQESVPMAHAA